MEEPVACNMDQILKIGRKVLPDADHITNEYLKDMNLSIISSKILIPKDRPKF